MIRSPHIVRAFVVLSLVVLAACSKKPEGTYYADFDSSNDPNVALAAALMKLSLTFKDSAVTMEVSAMGNSETVDVDAAYDGDSVVLTKPDDPKKEKLILTVQDEDTLQCQQCPAGMPTVWRKRQ